MAIRLLKGLLLLLAPLSEAAQPSTNGSAVAGASSVSWSDPDWASDGTGAMPLGNGDLAASVWVDKLSGDLRLLLSKSDVFDENSQPVKTGALRLSFDPPLWQPGQKDWAMRLDLAAGQVIVSTPQIQVRVFAELVAKQQPIGVLHVTASGRNFSLTAAVEPYRRAGVPTSLGRGFCFPRWEQADTLVPDDQSVIWYHWNHLNTTYFNDTMRGQGIEHPAELGLTDMFTGRAWGGSLVADGMHPTSSHTALEGHGLDSIDLRVTLLTLASVNDPAEWLAAIRRPASPGPGPSWERILDRSYVELSGASPEHQASAKQITDHVNWDRYLSLIQGRAGFAPIKFNGQAFNCNDTGKGWDTRGWGADYWWQNERQPYYNAIAQGDLDTMRSFLEFYLRMLPYVQARTAAQFASSPTPISAGALYPETSTQFGLYNEGDWGCTNKPPNQDGASSNTFIRFHWTGSLELALMILDYWDATADLNQLGRYLPIATNVVEAYRQRFPNRDAQGKIDMFPAQALETYQCPGPRSRDSCNTNPSTDIAGLTAVLSRLISLPNSTGVTSSQRASWQAHLAALPPLPTDPAKPGGVSASKIAPVGSGPWKRQGRHNSENTELYVAHPFRLFGVGKSDPTALALAQQTYAERMSPCNNGWCQDIIQAAMLNLTDQAADQLAQRAAASDHGGFRFEGFAGHYQDYEPSLDHYGFMRTGLNYMLMAPVDDPARSMVLFPSWPVDRWNVRFKLHAPLNTTIEASCQAGKLEYLIVTPEQRRADIKVLNCRT